MELPSPYSYGTDKLLKFQDFIKNIPHRESYKLNSPDHDMTADIIS